MLKYTRRVIKYLKILHNVPYILDEFPVCRVVFDIVVPVLGRCELHDEAMRKSALVQGLVIDLQGIQDIARRTWTPSGLLSRPPPCDLRYGCPVSGCLHFLSRERRCSHAWVISNAYLGSYYGTHLTGHGTNEDEPVLPAPEKR